MTSTEILEEKDYRNAERHLKLLWDQRLRLERYRFSIYAAMLWLLTNPTSEKARELARILKAKVEGQ